MHDQYADTTPAKTDAQVTGLIDKMFLNWKVNAIPLLAAALCGTMRVPHFACFELLFESSPPMHNI